jgi:hypothetical protein
MQNHRFERPEIRRDNRATIRLRDGPADDFQRRLVAQFGVGLDNLIGSHLKPMAVEI